MFLWTETHIFAPCIEMDKTTIQSVPLATSPMPETSKNLFGLVKFYWNLYKQLEENLKSSYFGLVAEKVFGTDCNTSINYNHDVVPRICAKIFKGPVN